ncbi:MAG: DNA polymerase III subunit epsilon [Eggerthellaceae bacterium]|nr:DNA polymerase III subunit epsilon [Eggerthellaceae bacterium]
MMVTDSLETYITEATPKRIVERYRGLKQAAEQSYYGELDDDVVVIDTETTGVSFRHDELTQIAAARMVKGEIVDWFVTFVNPGKAIPDDIVHLTNITQDDVKDAPSPEEAVAQLAEFVGTSDLVAHNANFDRHFCTKPASGHALRDNRWIDSLDLARIVLPRLKSHRLTDLVKAFDAPISTHRADADVEALCAIYRILLAGIQAMPIELVKEIACYAEESVWPTVRVFTYFADAELAGEKLSLRKMRQENVGKKTYAVKTDAESIARDAQASLQFASDEEIEEAFSPRGMVGAMYPDFEARSEQVQMSKSVNAAFGASENLAVEAGTGVGKSMAYLVPSVLAAKKNNITVGVATKTNALLDQLVNHELPLLSEACGGITYSALKGFSHYPCMRKIEQIATAGPRMRSISDGEVCQAAALAGLLSFIEQSEYDDIDGLKIDYRALPRWEITTTSHDCLRRKCPFFGSKCFVHGARMKAEASDIVVTNQTLLFCDVAAEGGLLPAIRYWVVDEAHGAESEARRAFSCKIDVEEIRTIVSRVSSEDVSRNVFLRAERRLTGAVDASAEQMNTLLTDQEREEARGSGLSDGDTLMFALSGKAKRAGMLYAQTAEEFCLHVKDLLYFEPQKQSKGYDYIDLWLNDDIRASSVFQNLVSLGRAMCEASEKLIRACQQMVGIMEDVRSAAAVQRDIASLALKLKEIVNSCELILFQGSDAYAYAAHLLKHKGKNYRAHGSESLEALMMNVGDYMNETLYARTHSVVFTSATMTIADSFDNFGTSLGFNTSEFSKTRTEQLPSSYDFDGHMTVYVASDIPEPNDPHYLDALTQFLIGIHRAQQGSTLTLFTNRREMEKSYDVVNDALKADDLRVVCQKWGVSVKGLRDDFIADEHLSLFALKSFWEGFDAPGATLKAVVIPKLPFSKPTDPLSCARGQVDPKAWSHYVLPAAVMETKQAAGRLIRSADDRGNLILADKRLITKGYGKVFLKSMPSHTVKQLTMREICEELAMGN